MRCYVLGNVQSEDMFINGMRFWGRYYINTTLLVTIHIICTQSWAVPFPCSKTKSKISFSLGWAQEGLIVVPFVTTYAVPLRMRMQTQTITKKEPVIPILSYAYSHHNLRGYFDEMRRKLNF